MVYLSCKIKIIILKTLQNSENFSAIQAVVDLLCNGFQKFKCGI